MKTLLEGKVGFIENYNNWTLEVHVSWNKRKTYITVKSIKNDLKADFPSCKLSKSNTITILSYITRSRTESYSFNGTKSSYSELLLKSNATKPLLNSKNASIKLEGKYLVYSGGINKNDFKSLSNIFILNEILLNQIDYRAVKNIIQQHL